MWSMLRGLRDLISMTGRKPIRHSSYRPRLETLEERLAPATHTWDGSASTVWSNPANWAENVAPAAGEANLRIVFPFGAANTTNQNDIANLKVQSISFEGGLLWQIDGVGAGATILLSGGISANVIALGSTVDYRVNLNLKLTASQTVNVLNNAVVTLGGVISGASNLTLTKTGINVLRFAGATANTFAGVVKVNEGTLELNKPTGVNAVAGSLVIGGDVPFAFVTSPASQQIADKATVTIGGPGRWDLAGTSETIGSLNVTVGSQTNKTSGGTITLNGNVVVNASTNGALINSALNLGSATRTFTVANGAADDDLVLLQTVTNGGITKAGAGRLALFGANDYAGATMVNAGTLRVAHALGLGSTVGGTSVADGASLQLQNAVVAGESLALRGKGVASAGALQGSNGTTGWTGPINLMATLTSKSVFIGVDAGTMTVNSAIVGAAGLTKVGAATLGLGGAVSNTYAGTTQVNSGSLSLQKNAGTIAVPKTLVVGDGIGAPGTDIVSVLAAEQIANGASVFISASGVMDLFNTPETITGLTMAGGRLVSSLGSGTLNPLGNITVNASANESLISAIVNLGGATRTFNVGNGLADKDLNITSEITNGSVTKTGSGKLTLAGANTYTGLTMVSAGIVQMLSMTALGTTAGGTTVSNGASLHFGPFGSSPIVVDEALTLIGAGFAGGAKFVAHAGVADTWDGPIIINGTTANPGIVFDVVAGSFALSDAISGTGGLTKIGAGGLVLGGTFNNTYAGVTRVNAGTLLLSKTGATAIPLGLIIGDGLGGPLADVVRLASANQIADIAAVFLNAAGLFDLADFAETIDQLTASGGHLQNIDNLAIQ